METSVHTEVQCKIQSTVEKRETLVIEQAMEN